MRVQLLHETLMLRSFNRKGQQPPKPQMWVPVPREALGVCSKTVMQRAFNPSDAGSTPVMPIQRSDDVTDSILACQAWSAGSNPVQIFTGW